MPELAATGSLHPRAAYAAVMAGHVEQAVALLEQGRARGVGDTLARDRAELTGVREQDSVLAAAFETAATDLRNLEAAEWRAEAMARDRHGDSVLFRAEPGPA